MKSILDKMIIAAPFRLHPFLKDYFEGIQHATSRDDRNANRKLFEAADGIIGVLDTEGVKAGKSIGTKLEIRFGKRQNKLVAVYLVEDGGQRPARLMSLAEIDDLINQISDMNDSDYLAGKIS